MDLISLKMGQKVRVFGKGTQSCKLAKHESCFGKNGMITGVSVSNSTKCAVALIKFPCGEVKAISTEYLHPYGGEK